MEEELSNKHSGGFVSLQDGDIYDYVKRYLGKYTDLEVYHEVEEIIAEKLEQGIKESD